MNNKYKILFSGLTGFIIVIICITITSIFLKDNANYGGFIGSVVGVIISSAITLVVLFITIKQGNENQKKALNTQSALQAENNLLHTLENHKKIIAESVNKLDDLLFRVQILKISGVEEISDERKNMIDIFSDYRKAMNTIRLNTDIYMDTSKCDGCTDCDIKSYGELSKRKTKLCECFSKIEYNCNMMMQDLQTALDEAIDTNNLSVQKNLYQQQLFSYEGQIQILRKPFVNNDELEKIKQYEEECAKLKEKIMTIDAQIQSALEDIGEKNKKARIQANNIQMNDRNELYNAMMKYFEIYSFYVKENKNFVMKNGTLADIDKVCKKYMIN